MTSTKRSSFMKLLRKMGMTMGVALSALIFVAVLMPAKGASAAEDKFKDTFFPKGKIETPEMAPYAQFFDEIKAGNPDSQDYIDLWWYQPSDVQALTSKNDALSRVDKSFDEEYGTYCNYEIVVQFDAKIDSGKWSSETGGDWDHLEYDGEGYGYSWAFYPYSSINVDDSDKVKTTCQAWLAGVESPDDENFAWLSPILSRKDTEGLHFDLDSHKLTYRYRYVVSYVLKDDEDNLSERLYFYSDWSPETSIGKGGKQRKLKAEDSLYSPVTFNPVRTYDENGKWSGGINYALEINIDTYEDWMAYQIIDDISGSYYIQVEANVNGLGWYEIYTANPDAMVNGTRSTSIDKDHYANEGIGKSIKLSDDTRVYLRAYYINQALDKTSKKVDTVPAVKNIKVSETTTTSLKLTWDKVPYATGYEVFDGSGKLLALVEKNEFLHKGLKEGTGYDYQIRAIVDKVFVGALTSFKAPTKTKKVTLSSFKTPKKITVEAAWKKLGAGTGYQIQIATDKNFKKIVKDEKIENLKTLKYTLSILEPEYTYTPKPTDKDPDPEPVTVAAVTLKSGTKYYVRIRGYKTYGSTAYGAWSSVKNVKCK